MSRRSKIAATVAAGAALGVLAVRASDVAGWVR